jgi:hypothetical protein
MKHQDEDADLCPLPITATREEKMEWLLNTGETMLSLESIALPLLKWDRTTQQERDALDRIGFLFESYEVLTAPFPAHLSPISVY